MSSLYRTANNKSHSIQLGEPIKSGNPFSIVTESDPKSCFRRPIIITVLKQKKNHYKHIDDELEVNAENKSFYFFCTSPGGHLGSVRIYQ